MAGAAATRGTRWELAPLLCLWAINSLGQHQNDILPRVLEADAGAQGRLRRGCACIEILSVLAVECVNEAQETL